MDNFEETLDGKHGVSSSKKFNSTQVANMEFERRQNSGQLLSRLLEADKILRWELESDILNQHANSFGG